MKLSKTIYLFISTLLFLFVSSTSLKAATYDFVLTNDTTLRYSTGQEYILVENQFIREVKNSKYYISTTGEKTFHIPDIRSDVEEEIKAERDFKKTSLSVKSDTGKTLEYTIEELEFGEGMYIKVPNYKETKYGSKYEIVLSYNTHDFVKKVFNSVVIEYPILSEDTQFEQKDESTNTLAQINYNLSIQVDKSIPPLFKIYPSGYTVNDEDKSQTIYSFSSKQRLGQPIYLEFGTNQVYRFELKLKTIKTDTIIPQEYSSKLPILSTNIYQLHLPREYGENNQTVKIESLSPKPTKLDISEEGNVTATFEVPANQESSITGSGYIWVEQKSLSERKIVPNPSFSGYLESIKKDSNLSKYLLPTKYWQANDEYIQQEAQNILKDKNNLSEVITEVYKYVNDKLEYDDQKATDFSSTRIGAKAALEGGPSVCMEYSDTMIAIFRAQGIPARAALGYTSLNIDQKPKISHQWVQIWIPKYGWLSIDPTYESPNMMIGQSIQYVLWNTFYDEYITDMYVLTADTGNLDFDPNQLEVKIYAVDSTSLPSQLNSYSEIETASQQNPTNDYLNVLVKTTPLGKALLIILPIATVLALLIILLSLILLLIKRVKARKASPNQPL